MPRAQPGGVGYVTRRGPRLSWPGPVVAPDVYREPLQIVSGWHSVQFRRRRLVARVVALDDVADELKRPLGRRLLPPPGRRQRARRVAAQAISR